MNKKVLLLTFFFSLLAIGFAFFLYLYYLNKTGDFIYKPKLPGKNGFEVVEKYPKPSESDYQDISGSGYFEKYEGDVLYYYTIRMTEDPDNVVEKLPFSRQLNNNVKFSCTRTEAYLETENGDVIRRSEVGTFFANDRIREEYYEKYTDDAIDFEPMTQEEVRLLPVGTRFYFEGSRKIGTEEEKYFRVHFIYADCN